MAPGRPATSSPRGRAKFRFPVFLGLIRAIFARWNFFDQIAHEFELRYRLAGEDRWRVLDFDLPRRPLSLWFNPEVTFAHACVNLLEHFAADVQAAGPGEGNFNHEAVQRLSTFRMVVSLLRERLGGAATAGTRFKVVARGRDGETEIFEAALPVGDS